MRSRPAIECEHPEARTLAGPTARVSRRRAASDRDAPGVLPEGLEWLRAEAAYLDHAIANLTVPPRFDPVPGRQTREWMRWFVNARSRISDALEIAGAEQAAAGLHADVFEDHRRVAHDCIAALTEVRERFDEALMSRLHVRAGRSGRE